MLRKGHAAGVTPLQGKSLLPSRVGDGAAQDVDQSLHASDCLTEVLDQAELITFRISHDHHHAFVIVMSLLH
jgi:hypothetical protein